MVLWVIQCAMEDGEKEKCQDLTSEGALCNRQ